MTERDDAGIAEDQIEREREQREDCDLVEDQRLRWNEEKRRIAPRSPERDLGQPASRGIRV